MKKPKLIFTLLFLLLLNGAKAQIDFQNQLNEIPPMVSQYVDFLLYDVTNYQGATYLNTMNTTGKVLDRWELSIGVNAGTAIVPSLHREPLTFSRNFVISGSEPSVYWCGPNLFGSTGEGDIFFQFIDESVNGPVYNPFTGEKVGFSIPLIAGLGTGVAFSPAVMPKISLGIGLGTEVMFSILPGAMSQIESALPIDFLITQDLMYAFGLKHDIFKWIRPLNERDYHFSLGMTYSALQLGMELEEGTQLFGNYNTTDDYYYLQDNFKGISYLANGLGIEAIVTKSFGFVDLSLFTSSNQSSYIISSDGDISFSVRTSYMPTTPVEFDEYLITELVDVNNDIFASLYGAAIQFNLGGLRLGLKYAHQNGIKVGTERTEGTHYFATNLNYNFKFGKK